MNKEIHEKLEKGWILSRVILEIVGKPKEHVEKTITKLLEAMKKEKFLQVLNEKTAEIQKQENDSEQEGVVKDLWATFAELEILFENQTAITGFCFAYMPSSIEILEPTELSMPSNRLSSFFNDLAFRLHEVTRATHELKSQYTYTLKNFNGLFTNFLLVLIGKQERTIEELAKATGANEDTVGRMIDLLIEKEKVTHKDGKYSIKK